MNKASLIDIYIARAMTICFFLPANIQVFILLLSTIYFVARSVLSGFRPIPRELLTAILLGSGYLLYLIYIPVTAAAYKQEAWMYCEHRASFFVIPLAISLTSPYFRALIKNELIYFAYGCFISCLVGNGLYIIHHFINSGEVFSHVLYRNYFEEVTMLHPTYMSLYLGFSIFIITLLPTRIQPWLKYALYYLLFIFFFSLLAKTPIAAFFIATFILIKANKGILRSQKIMLISMVVALVSVAAFVPFFGQRIHEMVQYADKKDTSANVVNNSMYARKLVWQVDKKVLKDNWMFGAGPGKVQSLMNIEYDKYYQPNHIAPVYYGPHNEFMNEWMAFGILGIIVLLFTLCLQYYVAYSSKDYLYLALLILLSLTFATETVLSRQQGVTFYALFTSLFFFINFRKKEKII